MSTTANFKVDPRLASILGESYRNSEYALKELIDNAWDAEAAEVQLTLLPTGCVGTWTLRNTSTSVLASSS